MIGLDILPDEHLPSNKPQARAAPSVRLGPHMSQGGRVLLYRGSSDHSVRQAWQSILGLHYSPFPFPPGHKTRLHIPASQKWGTDWVLSMIVPFPGPIHVKPLCDPPYLLFACLPHGCWVPIKEPQSPKLLVESPERRDWHAWVAARKVACWMGMSAIEILWADTNLTALSHCELGLICYSGWHYLP